ncbi:MAG: hypothetical protein AAGG99_09850 [Pseudomonadota bacterium]
MLLPSGPHRAGARSRPFRSATLVVALAAGTMLAGCTSGFQPMYASADINGVALDDKLRSVSFATIPGRVGQRIRNALIFETSGGAVERVEKKYRLEVSIVERKQTAVVASDGDSIAQVYQLSASFRLLRVADGRAVLIGTSVGRAALQRFSQIYANVRALRDAQDRAATTVSRDLRSRLEAYLATEV